MGYNESGYAFTPCQLGQVHSNFTNNIPTDTKFDFCEISEADIVIETGEDIVWNSSRYLRSNVIIEKGATLEINCLVGMPQNAKFYVQAGGRLNIYGYWLYRQ